MTARANMLETAEKAGAQILMVNPGLYLLGYNRRTGKSAERTPFNFLVQIVLDGERASAADVAFAESWPGQFTVIRSAMELMELLGCVPNREPRRGIQFGKGKARG